MRIPVLLAAASIVALAPALLHAQAGTRSLAQRDVVEAQRQHPEVVAEFGGAETGQRAVYVDSIGRRVAAYSGTTNAHQSYRFTMLNSAVENAFAVPGGYIYITRQLMGLMNDEAELGFVLGHEVGHVAGRHSQSRQSAASRNTIGSILGVLLGGIVGGGVGDLIAQGAAQASKFATLRFSRDQEYQADTLGIRYVTSAGYDPAGSNTMLAALGRASALQARVQGTDSRSLPEWASTHPLSENRVQRARNEAQRTGRAGRGLRNRDQFLAQLDGILVDDDPAQGVIDGRLFTHPDLRLQFAVPAGYLMQNGTRAVTIQGSAGQAQFAGGQYRGNLESYIAQVINGLTGGQQRVAIPQPQRTTVNGLPAAYTTARASTQSGVVDVSVMAYQRDSDTVYHFVMLTRGGVGIGQFSPMIQSLRRITQAEAATIRPRVIDVVTVRPGDTVQSLGSRMAYNNFRVERFASLNGLAPGASLAPGQRVKLIVYGVRTSPRA